MEIIELLGRLADEHVEESDHPEEFQRAADLTAAGDVVFSCPEPPEWYACEDVPPGSHPVHVGVVRRNGQPFVTMVLVPLAEPDVIATADFEDAAEDRQPLDSDLGLLWGSTAMAALPAGDALDAFVARLEAELSASGAPWVSAVADAESGANVLAFPVLDDSALCLEGRDEDGKLVALLFTGTL